MNTRTFLHLLSLMMVLLDGTAILAQEALPAIAIQCDIPYKASTELTEYEQRRCLLDVYRPVGAKDLPALIWLHGGGLTEGDKKGQAAVCRALASEGFVVAAANYRLSPEAKYPAYLDDAAAAAAWLHAHASAYGAEAHRVFVGGHSAGAYLAAMVGLDPQFLQRYGLRPGDFAGFIPDSAQMTTHFTVKAERGIPKSTMIVDEAAPLNHVAHETPPFLAFYADNDMPFRREENWLLYAAFVQAGNRGLRMLEIAGHDHGGIGSRIAEAQDPVRAAMVEFMRATPPAK